MEDSVYRWKFTENTVLFEAFLLMLIGGLATYVMLMQNIVPGNHPGLSLCIRNGGAYYANEVEINGRIGRCTIDGNIVF